MIEICLYVKIINIMTSTMVNKICRVYDDKYFNKLSVSSLNIRITINTKCENLVNVIIKKGGFLNIIYLK